MLEIIERTLRSEVATFTGATAFTEDWDLEEMLTTLKGYYPTTLTEESILADEESERGRPDRAHHRRCTQGI